MWLFVQRYMLLLLMWFAPMLAKADDGALNLCQQHIKEAEEYFSMPKGLLMAIALTESGRMQNPWPWALNINGEAFYPASRAEARALMRDEDGRSISTMAVGCMQLYMKYHAAAFGGPEMALDPEANVWYAANFLSRLKQRHGSWTRAVAWYHGSNKRAQRVYICQVWRHMLQIHDQEASLEALYYCGIDQGIN